MEVRSLAVLVDFGEHDIEEGVSIGRGHSPEDGQPVCFAGSPGDLDAIEATIKRGHEPVLVTVSDWQLVP